MASRARGRQTGSLTNEQLHALGCVGKDIPQVQSAPPPTFPPLTTKPVNLETTAAQNYQILWKEDFFNYMRDYYLTPTPKKTADQRYSDQYNKLLENTRAKCKSEIPWEIIPAELKHSGKRKNVEKQHKAKKILINKEKVLSQLENIEENESNDDNVENKNKQLSDSEKEDDDDAIPENEEDDEMDDENDYGNNYFDNGEAFNEEDDNLDDGPVY